MTPEDKDTKAIEAIFHDAALVEAEEAARSPEIDARARAINRRLDARVAELREKQRLANPAKPARPIRASLVAMTRETLLSAIEALTSTGDVQVAHRNLSSLTDDDLRRLLESLSDAE